MTAWRSPADAPLNRYVLGYGPRLPWLDPRDDPRRIVVMLRRYDLPDYRAGGLYWTTFGPLRLAYEEISAWVELPTPPDGHHESPTPC